MIDRNNYWYGKNVLITGINGFIGGNLAKRLVQKGATVYGIIRNIKGLEEIENMPGVRNIFHSMKIGDEVKDYRNCASRINHIIIVADTFDELNKLEDKVHETLQIETEPIGNVHQ